MILFKNRFDNIDLFQFSIGTDIIIIYWYHLERMSLLFFRKTITGLFLSTSSSLVASGLIMETAASAAGESSTSWVSSSLFPHCGQMTKKKCFNWIFLLIQANDSLRRQLTWGTGEEPVVVTRKSRLFSRGRGGGYSTKFYTGRLYPEVQPLALLKHLGWDPHRALTFTWITNSSLIYTSKGI